jgi:hypothetical protein
MFAAISKNHLIAQPSKFHLIKRREEFDFLSMIVLFVRLLASWDKIWNFNSRNEI